MNVKNGYHYSDEHIWVKVEGEKARIGITEFAQSEFGDIVFVELPEVGTELKINEPFGSVESVKTVSELYAPISGKVLEINRELESNPELVNESPYDKAWLLVMEIVDGSELDKLLSAEEYREKISVK